MADNEDISTGDLDFPIEQELPDELPVVADEFPAEQEPELEASSEEIIEAKPKPKNRVPGKTRINQLMREKYRAENEAQQLKAENERLRQQYETSSNAAMSHYDNTVKLKLERAKQLKTQAIENGDVSAQIEADVELSRVAAQMEQLDAWHAQQNAQQQRQQYEQSAPQQQVQPEMELNEDTESWLADNSWFVPNSPDYDPDMQAEVQAYADALDRRLRRTGQESKIMSREYFDEINNYVQKEFYNEAPAASQSKGLNMKPAPRSQVAPVGARPAAPNSPRHVTLTAEEKDFIKMAKIPEQEYLKQKVSQQKIMASRGGPQRG